MFARRPSPLLFAIISMLLFAVENVKAA
jgi:hypothetical protein